MSPVPILVLIVSLLCTHIAEVVAVPAVKWSRPRIRETSLANFENFANTPKEFRRFHKLVYLDSCHLRTAGTFGQRALTNRWDIFDQNETAIFSRENRACYLQWAAPLEGSYWIKLRVLTENNHSLAEIRTEFFVKDIWFVVLGDSYASGQGNPDVRSQLFGMIPAKWVDRACYRSARGSFSFLTYEKIALKFPKHGILFTYLACSGASVAHGILAPRYGGVPAQLAVFESILNETRSTCNQPCKSSNFTISCQCKFAPDVILLTGGGNDLGYEQLALKMFLGTPYSEFQAIPQRLKQLENSLNHLQDRLITMNIDRKSIFFVEYFDLLRNDFGLIDANCEGVGLATTWDFYMADNVVRIPINSLIGKISEKHGWNLIDGIDELFSRHGICAGNSFIRQLGQSVAIQGDVKGAFHPNYRGHRAIAEIVWDKIDGYLIGKIGEEINVLKIIIKKE